MLIFVHTERNLNPKAACLKRREEEKTEELPGRLGPPTDLAQQAALGGPKVGPPPSVTLSHSYSRFLLKMQLYFDVAKSKTSTHFNVSERIRRLLISFWQHFIQISFCRWKQKFIYTLVRSIRTCFSLFSQYTSRIISPKTICKLMIV